MKKLTPRNEGHIGPQSQRSANYVNWKKTEEQTTFGMVIAKNVKRKLFTPNTIWVTILVANESFFSETIGGQ